MSGNIMNNSNNNLPISQAWVIRLAQGYMFIIIEDGSMIEISENNDVRRWGSSVQLIVPNNTTTTVTNPNNNNNNTDAQDSSSDDDSVICLDDV